MHHVLSAAGGLAAQHRTSAQDSGPPLAFADLFHQLRPAFSLAQVSSIPSKKETRQRAIVDRWILHCNGLALLTGGLCGGTAA